MTEEWRPPEQIHNSRLSVKSWRTDESEHAGWRGGGGGGGVTESPPECYDRIHGRRQTLYSLVSLSQPGWYNKVEGGGARGCGGGDSWAVCHQSNTSRRIYHQAELRRLSSSSSSFSCRSVYTNINILTADASRNDEWRRRCSNSSLQHLTNTSSGSLCKSAVWLRFRSDVGPAAPHVVSS